MKISETYTIQNKLGLSISILRNGSIRSIEAGPIRISMKAASVFSKSGTNIYLRKRAENVTFKALLGADSASQFFVIENKFIAKGIWEGVVYQCTLLLSEKSTSWQWQVELINTSSESYEMDIIYVQDVGLKPATESLINEYYVSQYLERLILEDNYYGSVVCCRQNTKESVGNPWLMFGCQNGAQSASVDGIQFLGKTFRETSQPEALTQLELGGELSGESSMVALQEKPFKLQSSESHASNFVTTYIPNHSQATSIEDLAALSNLWDEFDYNADLITNDQAIEEDPNLFSVATLLKVEDLSENELSSFFGQDHRHPEYNEGKLISFFSDKNNHIALRAKELLVDRPHGHIMQAWTGYEANENILSTTTWAYGVFNSHLTQGNTNFNIFLSICSSQFNHSPETGQRIFVEINNKWHLLGIPSAYEIGLNHCRWIYKTKDQCFQVRTWTSKTSPKVTMDFKVLKGEPVRLIVSNQFDEGNGWTIKPEMERGDYISTPKAGSMILEKFPKAQFRIQVNSESLFSIHGDEALYESKVSHGDHFFVVEALPTSEFSMSFIGEVCETSTSDTLKDNDNQFITDTDDAQRIWDELSLNLNLHSDQKDIAAIQEILPWFGMNAITHFLTPHGLEQFGGAAWGTRDVSQGPLDLLLIMEKYDAAKETLRVIFSNQNPDGGWPQWWMFDSYRNIRAGDSHGDIYYWTIIALSNYIKVTGDTKILEEVLPYFHADGVAFAEQTPLSEHIDRLIQMIIDSFIPGTALVPFGGGDWNDSLQPVSHELAQRMISSWTVEMNYQAFEQYQVVYELIGNIQKSNELRKICEQIKSDFNKHLIKDGIVAGYGLVEKDGSISVLLHPTDTTTNIHYSLLPMDRGIISGIFTKEQATLHQDLLEKYLKGPDGARLMDKPLVYKGGIQTIFQRAESSTFFGREIGLMYIHEHIRYAECQAITGRAEAFIKALRQANPVAYNEIVSCGDIRQANCYYSSSDVAFKSRYDADKRYDEVKTGNLTLRGGWRVYSSGPGIYVGLIVTRMLGLRIEYNNIVIDPVMPLEMNGLTATIDFLGYQLTIKYNIQQETYHPKRILMNGNEVSFTDEFNNYRIGGAVIARDTFISMLNPNSNTVEIYL